MVLRAWLFFKNQNSGLKQLSYTVHVVNRVQTLFEWRFYYTRELCNNCLLFHIQSDRCIRFSQTKAATNWLSVLTVNSEAANFLGIPSSFPNDLYLFKGVLEGSVISFSCIGNELAYSRAYIWSHGSIQRLLIFAQGQWKVTFMPSKQTLFAYSILFFN